MRLAQNEARSWLNLGKILDDLDQRDEAIACFIKALQREPENAEAHLGIGQMLLAEGNYRSGWVEYEWRNRLDQARNTLPRMVTAEWNGMRMPADRILLIADQGFSDSIQFARYIPMVAEQFQSVVLACSPELAELMGMVSGLSSIHTSWETIPPHSTHSLLSTLPRIFGTELDSIPRVVPYLSPHPPRRAVWAERLRPMRLNGKPIVGIVWAGRPVHPNDQRRSMRLDGLRPLAALAEIQLVSLQKPVPEHDRELFNALGLHDWSSDLVDFSETLALIAETDCVVSVDSGVAHLAGAAAHKTWLMLPSPADWRWMKSRRDTPWYPTMEMFRQREPGDWGSVVAEVVNSVLALAQQSPRYSRQK